MAKKETLELKCMIAQVLAEDGSIERIYATSNTDAAFLKPIGYVITSWSMWEMHVNDLISALLRLSQKTETGWYGLPYKKREELLVKEWNIFAQSSPFLIDYMVKTIAEIGYSKILRDHIAHNIIYSGIDFVGNVHTKWIRFRRHKSLNQYTRKYTIEDVKHASGNLGGCAGNLHFIRDGFQKSHFSPEDKLLLSSIPVSKMGHFPI